MGRTGFGHLAQVLIRKAADSDRLRPHLLHLLHLTQGNLGAGNFGNMYATGEYRFISAAAQCLGSRPVIMDIGANDGQWSAFALAAFPKSQICCIEPGAAAFKRLQERFRAAPDVRLLHGALGPARTTATLYGGSGLGEFASLHRGLLDEAGFMRDVAELHEETVEVFRVDDALTTLIGSASDLALDFVKVDTEGSEFEIIRQLMELASPPSLVQFEFGTYSLLGGRPLESFAALFGSEYVLKRLGPRVLVDQSELSPEEMNFFGYSNWCAVRKDIAVGLTSAYRTVTVPSLKTNVDQSRPW